MSSLVVTRLAPFERWRYSLAAAAAVVAAATFFHGSLLSGSVGSESSVCVIFYPLLWTMLIFASTVFILGGWRFVWIVCRTLRRDVRGILIFVKMKLIIRKHVLNGENIPSLFAKTVEKYKDKICFYFEDQTWTFLEVDEFSNRVAHYFLSRRLDAALTTKPVVALMMESRPEFVGFWLGLAKIDIPTALLNSKLRLESIAHSLEVVKAQCLIYDIAHQPFVNAAKPLFPPGVILLCYNPAPVSCGFLNPDVGDCDNADFHAKLLTFSSQPVPSHAKAKSKFEDLLLYIFTSGTTGLPKAALIRQQRFYVAHFAMTKAFNISPDDVVYNCLPLYHAAGNNLGVGLALMHGCSVALTKKFSARGFWDDCRKYKATIIQYIGEICRYLLAQPPGHGDVQHNLRLALGNGLRPQIWCQFQQRFSLKQIGEFYAATEGNANMLNTANHAGAIGFTSPLFRAFHPISFIKMDRNNEQVLRDDNGICLHCKPGEEGQLVGRIPDHDRLLQFDGYVNQRASDKKILQNVWREGDRAFASGDLMMMDELGFVYFRDRIGDTFRWKGENVSTAEVEAVIMEALGLGEDVAVYGVSIPGTEGRAGMAAIYLPYVDDDDASGDKNQNVISRTDLGSHPLLEKLKLRLPIYAIPVFLRLLRSRAESTGSFKIKKTDLRESGFDLKKIGDDDQIYFLNPQSRKYQLMNEELFVLIQNCDLKF